MSRQSQIVTAVVRVVTTVAGSRSSYDKWIKTGDCVVSCSIKASKESRQAFLLCCNTSKSVSSYNMAQLTKL